MTRRIAVPLDITRNSNVPLPYRVALIYSASPDIHPGDVAALTQASTQAVSVARWRAVQHGLLVEGGQLPGGHVRAKSWSYVPTINSDSDTDPAIHEIYEQWELGEPPRDTAEALQLAVDAIFEDMQSLEDTFQVLHVALARHGWDTSNFQGWNPGEAVRWEVWGIGRAPDGNSYVLEFGQGERVVCVGSRTPEEHLSYLQAVDALQAAKQEG